jgi:2-keto-4-pentenoate hydratase
MSETDIQAIAGALAAARRKREPVDAAGFAGGPRNRADAYAVQQAVAAEIAPAAAFKTGRKGPGDEPIMAPILAGTVRDSGAAFNRDELFVIGIELEIGFRVNRPLPDPGRADFEDALRDCISVVPAIEIVDTRLADPEAAGEFWQLADNQNNGGLVCGTPVEAWHDLDMEAADIELSIGGDTVNSGRHHVPGGSAFDVLCAFARIAGNHCGGILPGQTIITGSLMGCHYLEPGQNVSGTIAGLGHVEVGFP